MKYLLKAGELFFIDRDMAKSVSAEITEENRRTLSVMSTIAGLAFIAMTVSSLFFSSIHGYMSVYLSFAIISILSLLLSRFKESEMANSFHVYIFIFMMLLFGVLLGSVFSPYELSESYVVLLLAVPLVFVVHPAAMNGIIIFSILIYMMIAEYTQTHEMFVYNMISITLFGVLSMLISSFTANIKIQRIYFQKKNMLLEQSEKEKVEIAATHDKLTGCKNRNALEWVYSRNYDINQPMAMVMCDLNGLKQVNDLQGHGAGDAFIMHVSDTLKSSFGAENVYRIGGDEFLIILLGGDSENIDVKIAGLRITLGGAASIGFSAYDRADVGFDEMLSEADSKMYADKQKYYAAHPEKKDGRQAVMEYKDILSKAGLGIWHIILKDGEKPRMQADEKMAELLGIDADKLSEEEIYSSWFDHIPESELPSVNASVKEMLNGVFSENTYIWEHPAKGMITVRCGGTATALPDGGFILRGYHMSVTNKVSAKR